MPFTRRPHQICQLLLQTTQNAQRAKHQVIALTGRGFGEKETTGFTHVHTHIYFYKYIFWHIYFSMFTYLISTFLCLLQELLFPSRRKWTPGLFQEELSDQYVTRASITHCSTLHKFTDSEPRSQLGRDCPYGTSDRSGHLLCEKRARSGSECLFFTAAKPGLGLEIERKNRAAPTPATLQTLQAEITLKHLRRT